MKIPSNDLERLEFYRDVIQKCFVSLEQRKGQYSLLKHYYLYGCPPEEVATPFNKISPHLDTLTAFLFSADTTRFGLHLPRTVHESEWEKVPAANELLNEEWQDSGGDKEFGMALTWALVYQTALTKVVPRDGRPNLYMVDPGSFGVYREDIIGLDRQEAFCHRFYTTKTQLAADLAAHPNRQQILAAIEDIEAPNSDAMPETLRRIMVTNQLGVPPISPGSTILGNGVAVTDAHVDYTPRVAAQVVEMDELWIWDDDLDDYRVVTMCQGGMVVYDRQNFMFPSVKTRDGKLLAKGDHPFAQICPVPMPGNFWGQSEVAGLIGLQQWLNERIAQIRDLLAKQIAPPTTLFGMFGALDEMDFALNKAGGILPTQDPMAKVERHRPEITADVWQDVHMIMDFFSETSGLQNLLMGKGESGVRSGRQTSELARLGSSRVKKRALIIEDSLGQVATKYFKAMRRYNADRLTTTPSNGGKPVQFVLSQMPHDAQVRVDAHSNSPLFVEDQKQMAFDLFKAKAIERSRLIEMIDPPMKAIMKRELASIERKEAAAAAAQAQQAQAQKPKS